MEKIKKPVLFWLLTIVVPMILFWQAIAWKLNGADTPAHIVYGTYYFMGATAIPMISALVWGMFGKSNNPRLESKS